MFVSHEYSSSNGFTTESPCAVPSSAWRVFLYRGQLPLATHKVKQGTGPLVSPGERRVLLPSPSVVARCLGISPSPLSSPRPGSSYTPPQPSSY